MFVRNGSQSYSMPMLDADDGKGGGGGADDGKGAGGNGDPNAGGKKIEFTPEQQAELDRIIAERVSRAEKSASKKAREARAKELGFESVEAMESVLKAHKEAQEKNKTDLQKAQEAKAEADRKAAEALKAANTRLINAEARVQATALGIKPERITHALKLADLSDVTVDEQGNVDDKAIKKALEQVLKEVPELKGAGSNNVGGSANPGSGGNTAIPPANQGMNNFIRRMAGR